MKNRTLAKDDARAKRLELRCPGCNRSARMVSAGYIATTVYDYRCRNPRCRRVWRAIVRPLKASELIVLRQVDWTMVAGDPITNGGW